VRYELVPNPLYIGDRLAPILIRKTTNPRTRTLIVHKRFTTGRRDWSLGGGWGPRGEASWPFLEAGGAPERAAIITQARRSRTTIMCRNRCLASRLLPEVWIASMPSPFWAKPHSVWCIEAPGLPNSGEPPPVLPWAGAAPPLATSSRSSHVRRPWLIAPYPFVT
jgi:hypothetical protein